MLTWFDPLRQLWMVPVTALEAEDASGRCPPAERDSLLLRHGEPAWTDAEPSGRRERRWRFTGAFPPPYC